MSISEISIIGAGGHGQVVLDALKAASLSSGAVKVFDDDVNITGTSLLGVCVQHPNQENSWVDRLIHLAIGNNGIRAALTDHYLRLGAKLARIVHPSAVLAGSSSVATGSFIAAKAIIGPSAIVGTGVIVNHGAVVDHECSIGAFSHIAPNATIGGKVEIGKGVLIGAGANIMPGLKIADGSVIGAGSVVLRDITISDVFAGVPARRLRKS